MNPIEKLFEATDEVYDYFGFTPDWVVYPFDDRRGFKWFIEKYSDTHMILYYWKDQTLDELAQGRFWADVVYTQRFYDKWIYRGEAYTMVFADTETDGMKYFAILENAKEITDTDDEARKAIMSWVI